MPLMMQLLLLAAAVTAGCMAAAPASTPASDGQARIAIDRGDTYRVSALFDGDAAEALTYRLEVVREGAAGRSTSAQGGAFEAAAGRTDTLSTVQVSAAQGDRFEAHLVVRRGDTVVSETHIQETVR